MVLEEFDQLKEGQQPVQSRELCQFQKSDGDEAIFDRCTPREEDDERDWDTCNQVNKEP